MNPAQPDGFSPLFADFHFHSKYSRAVSQAMSLEGLAEGAAVKGLGLIGTGDFSHPMWFKELHTRLEEIDGAHLYSLKGDVHGIRYMLTNEVATFFSTPKGVKKVHHIIHAPSFEVVEQLNDVYSKMGNLAADGRPMFARTSSAEFVEKTMAVSNEILVYPAHCLTPWFGALGSSGGYDSLEECYEEQVKHIHALETGLSADPKMLWRLSRLDKFTVLSNSDAHSNHPWRLGRECNAFAFSKGEATYEKISQAIIRKDPDALLFTVETSPSYGKYHFDGHRLCNFSCGPQESARLKNRCPVCKRPLTIGVENRIEKLADRPEGFVPPNAIPFKTLLPLHELLSSAYNSALSSRAVTEEANKLLSSFPSELFILLSASEEELGKHASSREIVDAILLNREGKISVKPGFDGEYGVPMLPEKLVLGTKRTREKKPVVEKKQKQLDEF